MGEVVVLLGFKDTVIPGTIEQNGLWRYKKKELSQRLNSSGISRMRRKYFNKWKTQQKGRSEHLSHNQEQAGTMGGIFMAALRAATPKDTIEIQEVKSNYQKLGRMPKLPDW
eukprot:14084713-Ditylum_brightwellii.AAC.1